MPDNNISPQGSTNTLKPNTDAAPLGRSKSLRKSIKKAGSSLKRTLTLKKSTKPDVQKTPQLENTFQEANKTTRPRAQTMISKPKSSTLSRDAKLGSEGLSPKPRQRSNTLSKITPFKEKKVSVTTKQLGHNGTTISVSTEKKIEGVCYPPRERSNTISNMRNSFRKEKPVLSSNLDERTTNSHQKSEDQAQIHAMSANTTPTRGSLNSANSESGVSKSSSPPVSGEKTKTSILRNTRLESGDYDTPPSNPKPVPGEETNAAIMRNTHRFSGDYDTPNNRPVENTQERTSLETDL